MMDRSDTVLLEVVRHGSFSGAAKSLFLTPQAVTKQVSQIESRIGFQVFSRSPHGVSLTHAGETYISCVRRQQNERQAVLTACREESADCLRLGLCSNTMYCRLSGVLMAFRAEHPRTRIRFIGTRPENLLEDLQRGAFDACIYPRQPHPMEGISFFPLAETVTFCVVEQAHPLAGKETLTYGDLMKFPVCIGAVNRNPEILAALEAHGIHPSVSPFPPLFLCYDGTVYLTFMELDSLPCGLAQVPFESGFRNVSGIICREPVSPTLDDFLRISRSLAEARAPRGS